MTYFLFAVFVTVSAAIGCAILVGSIELGISLLEKIISNEDVRVVLTIFTILFLAVWGCAEAAQPPLPDWWPK